MIRKNIFSVEAENRQKEQEAIENKIGLDVPAQRKVPMNITLPPELKIKLKDYARKKNLSASIVIQMWIERFCK